MGGYDVFCALCGALASQPYWDEGDEFEGSYDPKVLKRENTEWMDDIRVIGENPSSASVEKVFVSGPAQCDDCGFVEVSPGNDPQFFGPEYMDRQQPGDTLTLHAYSWDEDYPVVIPFHAACYELLDKMVAPPENKTSRIDKEVLYRTLRSLCEEPTDSPFAYVPNRIDYGPVAELQEQYWYSKRGTEAFVSLPTIIPALSDYYKALPRRKFSKSLAGATSETTFGTKFDTSDVFSKFPVEILLWIMSYLDMTSVNAFRASTRYVSQVKLDNSFWGKRTRRDMPWLYDFPSPTKVSSEEHAFGKVDGPVMQMNRSALEDTSFVNPQEHVDWAQIYEDMLRSSKLNSTRSILGLVNRRRIWTLCQQITVPYLESKLQKSKTDGTVIPEIMQEVNSTPMLRLISPEPTEVHLSNMVLVLKLADLAHASPMLSVCWNSLNEFSGLTINYNNPSTVNVAEKYGRIGSPNHFVRHDNIVLESDNWLTGLILTSQENPGEKDAKGKSETCRRVNGLELLFTKRDPIRLGNSTGDKRLMHVSSNSVLIGFTAQWTSDGLVSKLALLQSELNSELKSSGRFSSPSYLELSTSEIKGGLWRDQLPPLESRISSFTSGYWSNIKTDLALMEALVLGTTEEELSNITAIAADVQFGGFEICYSNRKSRSIGPKLSGVKRMSIDGRGGERVVGLYTFTNHIPEAVRIVTNRGRQLIIGQPYSMRERAFFPEDSHNLVGIYAFWTERANPQSRLDAIGILSQPVLTSEDMEPPITTQDANQFFWDPEAPPTGWSETGPIYGQCEIYDKWTKQTTTVPGERTTVAWLDCSKPISSVVVSFVHATRSPGLPLNGIVLKYTDESQGQIGPSEFAAGTTDTDKREDHEWCWCHFGRVPKEELQKPHYTSDKWKVGNQRVRMLRLWIEKVLVGLQFVADDDTESPKWGKCESQPTGFIEFSRTNIGQPAVGLKAFIADNGRQTTRDDPIITCFQALHLKKEEKNDA